jgi:hypothetical protein
MHEIEQLLERQARWQRSLRKLTWAEKIRMAEKVRDSILLLRAGATRTPQAEPGPAAEETK